MTQQLMSMIKDFSLLSSKDRDRVLQAIPQEARKFIEEQSFFYKLFNNGSFYKSVEVAIAEAIYDAFREEANNGI